MTIQHHKAVATLGLCLLFGGACSGTDCRSSVILTVSQNDNALKVSISNSGRAPLTVDSAFALIGIAGGGNIDLIPVGEGGVLFKVCSYLDASPGYSEPALLGPGEEVSAEVLNVSLIKKLYCLPDGVYDISALYFDKRGNRFHSNVVQMQVDSISEKELAGSKRN